MRLTIFDNGGETADRYTVIIDADVYGMSANATSPAGVNQYCGDLSELPGKGWLTGRRLQDHDTIPIALLNAVLARVINR